MAEPTQNFESHRRWLAPWHFFVMPVLLINVLVAIRRLYYTQDRHNTWELLVAIAILLGFLLSRYMPLVTQDRLIRLEERTRLNAVLPADLRAHGGNLTRSQYVALRFAPDEELPELVRRIHSGELKSANDIKRAIKNWRADHIRI